MRKAIYLFVVIIVFCAEKASAQKDTVWVYMKYAKNSNGERTEIAENRDSADFMRMITTPDSSVDKTLYPVNDFYLNGKLKLRSLSIVNMAAHTVFQGTCLEYYPNGLKKSISNFEKGNQEGDIIKYYPNGKIYVSGSYYQHKFKLIECRDSTGKELAENGNGKWIKYSDDFKIIYSEGPVEDGIQQYDWKGRLNDTLNYICNYKEGVATSGMSFDKKGNQYPFTNIQVEPGFKGGLTAFGTFLSKNIHYPKDARQHKIQGLVIVTFIIERDGSLTDVHVVRGLEKSLDDEAVRVLKISPAWIPASEYGRPVRVQYTVPIRYRL